MQCCSGVRTCNHDASVRTSTRLCTAAHGGSLCPIAIVRQTEEQSLRTSSSALSSSHQHPLATFKQPCIIPEVPYNQLAALNSPSWAGRKQLWRRGPRTPSAVAGKERASSAKSTEAVSIPRGNTAGAALMVKGNCLPMAKGLLECPPPPAAAQGIVCLDPKNALEC